MATAVASTTTAAAAASVPSATMTTASTATARTPSATAAIGASVGAAFRRARTCARAYGIGIAVEIGFLVVFEISSALNGQGWCMRRSSFLCGLAFRRRFASAHLRALLFEHCFAR
jgi:hypothetical protein